MWAIIYAPDTPHYTPFSIPNTGASLPAWAAPTALPIPTINPTLAPDQSTYDPTDPELRDAAALLQKALNATTVQVCLGVRWVVDGAMCMVVVDDFGHACCCCQSACMYVDHMIVDCKAPTSLPYTPCLPAFPTMFPL